MATGWCAQRLDSRKPTKAKIRGMSASQYVGRPQRVDSSRPGTWKAAAQSPPRLARTPMTAFSGARISSRRQRMTGERSGPVNRSENGDRQERVGSGRTENPIEKSAPDAPESHAADDIRQTLYFSYKPLRHVNIRLVADKYLAHSGVTRYGW